MALKKQSTGRFWSRVHFLIRFLGLVGLLCLGVGAGLAYLHDILNKVLQRDIVASWTYAREVLGGETGDRTALVAVSLLAGGAILTALALLVELIGVLFLAAGRRSAFGLNATVQVALAAVLLVGINWFAFHHYLRVDSTRHHEFTIQPDIRDQLSTLDPNSKTKIVVYQQHKTFGQSNEKPDAYDYAAERKVVEKVRDLVEQFREFGPQFDVHVLDVEEEGYEKNLAELTKTAPELKQAIAEAPENSIFFYANGKVQRLSFNEFYQLDKTASRKANDGHGNLVLLYQGERPFARKVLNIDEKRPRVGLLVIHEVLTTQSARPELGMAGLRKSLTERGFDVRDILLKKWSEAGPPEPAVSTYDESRYDALEEQLTDIQADLTTLEEQVAKLGDAYKHWKTAKLEELTKEYADQLRGRSITEPMRGRQMAAIEQNQAVLSAILRQYREDRDATVKEKAKLNVDTAAEERRMTDLRAKLKRATDDCDLLLIPRLTMRNVAAEDRIPSPFYKLDRAQVDAVKDFIKAGRPVLACFGPANGPPDEAMRFAQISPAGPDALEDELQALGIRFGKDTVLFNAESKAFAERRSGLLFPGADVQVPPVEFEPLPEAARTILERETASRKPNRLLESMRIAAHSRGEKTLDLRVRNPRPIYYDPDREALLGSEPEFMTTSAASWNEADPFPSRERTPRFEPGKPDDPKKGTPDEKRRGPFPIGIAVETRVPRSWFDDPKAPPRNVRIAAIGSGGVFTGAELSTAREELLLNTCNWLLGRDDLLPRSDRVWSFPRVALGDKEHNVWHLGTWFGLPGIFFFMGLVVVMWRRLR